MMHEERMIQDLTDDQLELVTGGKCRFRIVNQIVIINQNSNSNTNSNTATSSSTSTATGGSATVSLGPITLTL
jgi:hypothetical protein